ncbi:MAG TPA: DUF4430 domain-containing protein [Thermoplasmatales archaeon]|nr:DUF4430 domain-containing protein [Thermoplasmatales archaeon]HEX17570.1 DUF4430 domain-containing protein [Thermoplasmatales archaeon]
MMKGWLLVISLVCLIIAAGLTVPALYSTPKNATNPAKFPLSPSDEEIVKALNFLKSREREDGEIGDPMTTAWAAMAFCSANADMGSIPSYLEKSIETLDPEKATDWERHALAIVACNGNPRNFGGIDFVEKIKSFYDGEQIGSKSLLNDDVWGIISLISCGVERDDPIIQNVRNYIIEHQNSDGGWGVGVAGGSDVDSTSATIMALISSGVDRDSSIIRKALNFLKEQQLDNGGFSCWGIENSASTSWAIMAISCAGEDPSKWIKNGNSPVDYLLSLQEDDGSFRWNETLDLNPEWMTSYAIPALLGKYYPVKIYYSSPVDTPPDTGTWEEYVKDEENYMTIPADVYPIPVETSKEEGTSSSSGSGAEWTGEESSYHHLQVETWTGYIRIEGKYRTIWEGSVTVADTTVIATNVSSNQTEEFYIPYPSVLGALIEASEKGGFNYTILYYPSWDALYVKSIDGDSDWWHYWVDYELPMVGCDKYKLTEDDREVLWGYVETWEAHVLKISVDKREVKTDEVFRVTVKDESNNPVSNATVHIDSYTFSTGPDGSVEAKIPKQGTYKVYAEKDGYVRSEKIKIEVKESALPGLIERLIQLIKSIIEFFLRILGIDC